LQLTATESELNLRKEVDDQEKADKEKEKSSKKKHK
jgi:hypothetical protein